VHGDVLPLRHPLPRQVYQQQQPLHGHLCLCQARHSSLQLHPAGHNLRLGRGIVAFVNIKMKRVNIEDLLSNFISCPPPTSAPGRDMRGVQTLLCRASRKQEWPPLLPDSNEHCCAQKAQPLPVLVKVSCHKEVPDENEAARGGMGRTSWGAKAFSSASTARTSASRRAGTLRQTLQVAAMPMSSITAGADVVPTTSSRLPLGGCFFSSTNSTCASCAEPPHTNHCKLPFH
jgi:hypothetical protein